MISSAIRKIEKEEVCAHIWKFCSVYDVNICSANSDREITFLTLAEQFAPRNFEIARSYLLFSLLYKDAKGAAVCHCRSGLCQFRFLFGHRITLIRH